MSRHRDVRNLDYDEEYDEAYDDAVYGHSIDDHEYGVSPNTEQYLYSQRDTNYGFGAYFTESEKIDEEDFEEELPTEHKRRDSSNYERPRLSSEDEVKLNSVLDEVRNVVGDQFSEADLVREILDNKYDFESSLNAVLTLPTSSVGTTSQSFNNQAAAQLPRTPKRDQPLRMQDETSKFCPFSFMLPLSYYFSSAFVFEKGHYERLPITKYVKEWTLALRKMSKDEKEKSLLKEFDNIKRIIPLSCKERNFLVELKGLSLDQIDSQLDVDKLTSPTGNFNSSSNLCMNEAYLSNPSAILTNKYNCSEGVNEITKNTISPVSVSDPHGTQLNFIPCNVTTSVPKNFLNTDISSLSMSKQHTTYTGNVQGITSFPPPGFNSLSINTSVLNSPTQVSNVKEETLLHNLPKLNCQSKLSILASTHLMEVSPLNKSSCTAKPTNPIPVLQTKTSLSALASAHLDQQRTNDNFFAIPALPPTAFVNNFPSLQGNMQLPISSCTIPPLKPMHKSDTLVPQLKMNYVHKPTAPSVLSSFCFSKQPALNFSVPKLHSTHDNLPVTVVDFNVPILACSSNLQTNLHSNFNMHASNVCSIKTDDITRNQAPSSANIEFSSDDALSPSIDLNIALNKNKVFDDKAILLNTKVDTKELMIEIMPSLTFAERRCLKRNPSTYFGKVITYGKRISKRKVLIRRQLFLPYQPFDFTVPSPDDLVRKALEKNLSKV